MLALLGGIWLTMGPFFLVAAIAHAFWVPWSAVAARVTGRGAPAGVA